MKTQIVTKSIFSLLTLSLIGCGSSNSDNSSDDKTLAPTSLATKKKEDNKSIPLQTTEENLTLAPFPNPQVSKDFNSSESITLPIKEATLTIPENSFQQARIHIDASYHDGNMTKGAPLIDNLTAIEDNQTFPINSYGMIRVQISDENSKKARLQQSATLSFPVIKAADNPQTLTLWNYDKQEGFWHADARAILNESKDAYEAQVSHFSSWNVGAREEKASFKGCIQDNNNTMLANTIVTLHTVRWLSLKSSNSEGIFSFENVPANEKLTLTIQGEKEEKSYEIPALQAASLRDSKECFILYTPSTHDISAITGHLIDEQNNSVVDATVRLRLNKKTYTTTSDAQGDFELDLQEEFPTAAFENTYLFIGKYEDSLLTKYYFKKHQADGFENLTITVKAYIPR